VYVRAAICPVLTDPPGSPHRRQQRTTPSVRLRAGVKNANFQSILRRSGELARFFLAPWRTDPVRVARPIAAGLTNRVRSRFARHVLRDMDSGWVVTTRVCPRSWFGPRASARRGPSRRALCRCTGDCRCRLRRPESFEVVQGRRGESPAAVRADLLRPEHAHAPEDRIRPAKRGMQNAGAASPG
jgi:hypothetical protein